MHGNQWVLKIAVLKYYSVSKRGTTAKSNPKQATDPISLHTKFGDNSSNTFPLNERKPPRGVDIIILVREVNPIVSDRYACAQHIVGWTLSRDPHLIFGPL